MLQIVENIESDSAVLHVLPDEVAYVLTRRCVDVLVAHALVDTASRVAGELNVEAAAQWASPSHVD